jgi:FkbM family methyltransferase
LGANVGYTGLYLKTIYPDCAYLGVEASNKNYLTTIQNLKLPNVKFLNKAIWTENSILHLTREFRDRRDWSIQVTDEPTEVCNNIVQNLEKVESITFTTLLEEYKIESLDFLKIDIEGAEEKVLLSRSFLEKINCVKCIAVEIHDEICDRQKICDVFSLNGFKWFNSGELVVAYKF